MGPGSPGIKQLVNPIYSLSQSDLGDGGESGVGGPSSPPTSSPGNDQTSGPSVQEILSGQREGEEMQTVRSILAQAAWTAQSTRSMKSTRSVRSPRQSVESEKPPDCVLGVAYYSLALIPQLSRDKSRQVNINFTDEGYSTHR